MTITYQVAMELGSAIEMLSKLETEGKNPIRLIFPGAVRFKIAKNLKELTTVNDDFSKKRTALVEEFGTAPEGSTIKEMEPNSPNWHEFREKGEAILQEKVDVPLKTLTLDELDLDSNPIPISVLDLLMPIIAD
jgi:hypothetical protein